MKRTLLTAITLYLLYDRQKRVEGRLKLWKLTRDADLLASAETICADLRRFTDEVNDQQVKFAKEVNRAFKGMSRV